MFTMAPMIEERLIEDIVRVVEHNRRGSVTSLTVIENLDSSSFAGSTEEFTNLNDAARVRSDSVENNTNTNHSSNNGNTKDAHKRNGNDAEEKKETASEDPNHTDNSSEDLLVQTTKSLQSLDLTSCQDDTHNKDQALVTCKSLPIPEPPQDSTQKLSSCPDDAATNAAEEKPSEPRRGRRGSRRRRRSLKDSLQALFSASSSNNNSNSNHSKRSSSPKARQRSSSPRSIHSCSSSSRGFTLSSLVPKRRSLHRKKHHRRSRHSGGRRRSSFASMDLNLNAAEGRSGPLRQSSSTAFTMRQSTSTAFTMAAREASEAFQLDEVMSDIEDDSCEALTPTAFQLDQTVATIH